MSTSCFRRCLVSVHGCSGGLSQAASDELLRENYARWFCWHLSVGDRILPGRAERLGTSRERLFAGPERPRGHRPLTTRCGVTTRYSNRLDLTGKESLFLICSGHLTSAQASEKVWDRSFLRVRIRIPFTRCRRVTMLRSNLGLGQICGRELAVYFLRHGERHHDCWH